MLEVFVGRQPVYDQQLEVIGYELLMHRYETNATEAAGDNHTASRMILNTFMEIGFDRLVGKGSAFIKLPRDFIVGQYPIKFFHDRVVLEVTENVASDMELKDALREISDRGFQIALDDVIDAESVLPLIDIINIIKVDISKVEHSHLEKLLAALKNKKIKFLAKNIETLDVFDMCRKIGFDYFQGFFLCLPNLESEHRIPASRMATLRLLTKLNEPNIEFKELEEIILSDVSLSYRLLRLVNSAFYAKPKEIESLKQALTLLGIRRIRDWVSLLLLSNIVDKPNELVITAMERAKMCELLSLTLKSRHVEMGFMIGMFSVLDALLDTPLEDIISKLPVAEEVSLALLQHEGDLGNVLNCVLAYERGEWNTALATGLDPNVIRDAFLESLDWATEVSSFI